VEGSLLRRAVGVCCAASSTCHQTSGDSNRDDTHAMQQRTHATCHMSHVTCHTRERVIVFSWWMRAHPPAGASPIPIRSLSGRRSASEYTRAYSRALKFQGCVHRGRKQSIHGHNVLGAFSLNNKEATCKHSSCYSNIFALEFIHLTSLSIEFGCIKSKLES